MFGEFFLRVFAWFLYFWMTVIHDFVKFVKQLEDYLDTFLIPTKPYLLDVGRIFVVSTFIQDGIRCWIQWDQQRQYMEETWNCGWYLATLVIFYNVFGQLIPSIMILSKKYVGALCIILTSILLLQTVTHNIPWSWRALILNIAIEGSLFLLFAANLHDKSSLFYAAAAQRDADGHGDGQRGIELFHLIIEVLTLFGSCFNDFMFFIPLVNYSNMTWTMFFVYLIALNLDILKTYAYKPRVWTMALVLWFFGINFCSNSWLMISTDDYIARDLMKSEFFQTISIIGGFILLVAYGPGGICLENYRRRLE